MALKISVRTRATKNSAVDLFKELIAMDGEQLLISSGYISQLRLLPWQDILQKVHHLVLASGHWNDKENRNTLKGVTLSAKEFALMVQREARSLNLKPPIITFFTGWQWHAKVALMRRKNDKGISGAVIGSSNLSYPALHQAENPEYFNQEVDVLITKDDGPDAVEQLKNLFKDLGASFEGQRVELGPAPCPWETKKARPVVSGTARSKSIALYRAAQATLTLTSAFHDLNIDAIRLNSVPFDAKPKPHFAKVTTFEMGLDAAEILLAGQAAWIFCDRVEQPFDMPDDLCAADLAYADRVLKSWRVPLLREDILKSAVEKLESRASEWLDIAKIVESEMGRGAFIPKGAIESIPSVKYLHASGDSLSMGTIDRS